MIGRATLLATLLWAGQAGAQSCADMRDIALDALAGGNLDIVDAGNLVPGGERCLLRGLELAGSGSMVIEVSELSWSVRGFQALASDETTPVRARIEVADARLIPQPGDPWMNYMMDVQNRRNLIDARFEAFWQPEGGRLEIVDFTVDFPRRNGLSLRSVVVGLDVAALRGMRPDPGALVVRDFSLVIENEGYFDGLLLGLVIGLLSDRPGDPATMVDQIRRELADLVAEWPGTVFADSTRAALDALLAEAPAPWGRLDIGLAAPDGLPLARFFELALDPAPLAPASLAAAFDGARVEIRYDPAGAGE